MSVNAANVAAVKRAGRAEKDQVLQEYSDLKHVLSSRPGRRLVRRWLEQHGLYLTVSHDAVNPFFFLGKRDAGLRMLAEVTQHDELYLRMEAEAREDARHDEKEAEAARQRDAEAETE